MCVGVCVCVCVRVRVRVQDGRVVYSCIAVGPSFAFLAICASQALTQVMSSWRGDIRPNPPLTLSLSGLETHIPNVRNVHEAGPIGSELLRSEAFVRHHVVKASLHFHELPQRSFRYGRQREKSVRTVDEQVASHQSMSGSVSHTQNYESF